MERLKLRNPNDRGGLHEKWSDVLRSEKEEYEKVTAETRYWHGTGRFGYNREGKQVDILRGILEDGGLIPQDPDNYNAEKTAQLSTSLGLSREISLKYADIHNENPQNLRRNVSMEEWVEGPLQDTIDVANYMLATSVSGEDSAEGAIRKHEELVKQQRPWASHFRSQAGMEPVAETFLRGSDIAGDYPILLGVKEVKGVMRPKTFAMHEVRVEGGVGLDKITHIEVPRGKIGKTRAVLDELGVEIPVVAIETGEAMEENDDRVDADDTVDRADAELMAKAKEWKAGNEAHERKTRNTEEEHRAEVYREVRAMKEELISEAKEFYRGEVPDGRVGEKMSGTLDGASSGELGEKELPDLINRYFGDFKEKVLKIRESSLEQGLTAEDFVEALAAAIGKEKLDKIGEKMRDEIVEKMRD